MKRLLPLVAVFSFFGSSALAAEWNGTLVDVMCKGQDLAGHTRKCAVECAKSGYAVVTADGNFYKLDEAGNAKALEALKASKKDKDLKAKVSGTLSDGVIQVDSLDLAE